MIGTLASDRPDQAFNMAVLPRRAERGGPVPNTHRSHAGFERTAKCSVIVADNICRCAVPRECFSDLACQPLGRRISCDRKPQQLSPSVAENKKREELLKTNRRNYKEINRCNAVSVIGQEGLPGLQRPISSRYHVLRDCRLGDVEAELEKLTVDVRCTPEQILEPHSSNKIAHLFVDLRSAAAGTGFPSPEHSEAFVMPSNNRLRPYDRYGVEDARKAAIKPNEHCAISPVQIWPMWR